MATERRETRYVWLNDKLLDVFTAKVNARARAFDYSGGFFGGIRANWSEEKQQLYLFRVYDHARRFLESAKLMRLTLPFKQPSELATVILELLRMEQFKCDVYIRPKCFPCDENIGIHKDNLTSMTAIWATPFGQYLQSKTDTKVHISSVRRIPDECLPVRAKCASTYDNSAEAKTLARLAGYDDALQLNTRGRVAEFSSANIFLVRDNILITPAATEDILPGITRKTIIEDIAPLRDLPVECRPVNRSELFLADEVFGCGTGWGVVAVTWIDGQPIGTGAMGPQTAFIMKTYDELIRGDMGSKPSSWKNWLTPVYANP